MCANIFSWYGGLFYQRASTEEEVVGARDPRRGPININKPTAPDPHHRPRPEFNALSFPIQIQIQKYKYKYKYKYK